MGKKFIYDKSGKFIGSISDEPPNSGFGVLLVLATVVCVGFLAWKFLNYILIAICLCLGFGFAIHFMEKNARKRRLESERVQGNE